MRDALATQIADKCEGMFLWVRLQEQQLRGSRHNNKRLQDVVKQMPPGLDCLYHRNWTEILRLDDYYQRRALAILRWTTFALRPLTVKEVTEALAVIDDDDCDDLCIDEMPDTIDEEYIEDEIIDICRSLVEVRPGEASDSSTASGTLHLAHFSVRQYLMSVTLLPGLRHIDRTPFADTATQQLYLARLCLRFVLYGRAWERHNSSRFLTYAAFAWYQHVAPSAVDDEAIFGLLYRLFGSQTQRWDQWQEHRLNHMEAKLGAEEQELSLRGPRLYVAATLGLLKVTDYLCGQPTTDLEEASGYLGTPLQASAAQGSLPLLKCLLSRGVDINTAGGSFGSALNAAAAGGHEDVVRYLVLKGANTALAGPGSRSALHLAAEGGHQQIAAMLLDRGQCNFAADEEGSTPLHLAAENGDLPMVSLLLDHEANFNVADQDGDTPLHLAAECGHVNIVKLLLDPGADLNASNKSCRKPIHFAAMGGRLEVVQLLLQRGADIAATSNKNVSPLIIATVYGHTEVVKFLLEHGADPAVRTEGGCAAVHCAAYGGYTEVLKLLHQQGTELHVQGPEDWTALYTAAEGGHTEVVRFLLEWGADHAIPEKNG
jgi:ankyrin repeat protein